MFVVGGFAESKYMYREISAMTKEFGGIETIKPIHAYEVYFDNSVQYTDD